MSGTAPKAAQGQCEVRACQRPYGHRGACLFKRCAKPGCQNKVRNNEEKLCVVHESRETYEKYQEAGA